MDPVLYIIIALSIATVITLGIVYTLNKWKAKEAEIEQKRQIEEYISLTNEIQTAMGLPAWIYNEFSDDTIMLKSSKAIDDYSEEKYFKEDRTRLYRVKDILTKKLEYVNMLNSFLKDNTFIDRPMYQKVEQDIKNNISTARTYNVTVRYISPAGKSQNQKHLHIRENYVNSLIKDPSVLMSKAEYSKLLKEQAQELLDKKHHAYYDTVNSIIDKANNNKDKLVRKADKDTLDKLIASLFDRSVNSIKKIKTIDSPEWDTIDIMVSDIKKNVDKIVDNNKKILDYYRSPAFMQIKDACKSLMNSQKEFNEYINEKAQSISKLFGTKIVRNETVTEDQYNYIRPYKKSITPFTAEVSSSVFSSAENNPIAYIVKNFYPDKTAYPEQIQKLQVLIEELETLKEARQIIENYKQDYQQYITEVPDYIMENDKAGFYSRLGFADISEETLTIEYKFTYTSEGGMAQRSFSVPMTEDTIVSLINSLQSGLSMSTFAKEQRSLMTSKLRQQIKVRDGYTCKFCGNSIYKEPNLLLEIDHIIPVAKGGTTTESNLQTLCWKCNRSKSSKIINI